MPGWIETGFKEYQKRMPSECTLRLHVLAPNKKAKNAPLERRLTLEGEGMMAAIPQGSYVIALDERGQQWTTKQLAQNLERRLMAGCDLALLIGGADGLAPACKQRADQTWGLSQLTLPHMMVRVVVAEQLYRAWSLLKGHPYHRE